METAEEVVGPLGEGEQGFELPPRLGRPALGEQVFDQRRGHGELVVDLSFPSELLAAAAQRGLATRGPALCDREPGELDLGLGDRLLLPDPVPQCQRLLVRSAGGPEVPGVESDRAEPSEGGGDDALVTDLLRGCPRLLVDDRR